MIASVRGTVLSRLPGEVVIESGGVGYRLAVSAETLSAVPDEGREAVVHAHLVVRDDSIQLFGFATDEERQLFLMLVGVQGVGPKVALAVLSGGEPARAPERHRHRRLGSLPGGARHRQAHGRADHRRAA